MVEKIVLEWNIYSFYATKKRTDHHDNSINIHPILHFLLSIIYQENKYHMMSHFSHMIGLTKNDFLPEYKVQQ